MGMAPRYNNHIFVACKDKGIENLLKVLHNNRVRLRKPLVIGKFHPVVYDDHVKIYHLGHFREKLRNMTRAKDIESRRYGNRLHNQAVTDKPDLRLFEKAKKTLALLVRYCVAPYVAIRIKQGLQKRPGAEPRNNHGLSSPGFTVPDTLVHLLVDPKQRFKENINISSAEHAVVRHRPCVHPEMEDLDLSCAHEPESLIVDLRLDTSASHRAVGLLVLPNEHLCPFVPGSSPGFLHHGSYDPCFAFIQVQSHGLV